MWLFHQINPKQLQVSVDDGHNFNASLLNNSISVNSSKLAQSENGNKIIISRFINQFTYLHPLCVSKSYRLAHSMHNMCYICCDLLLCFGRPIGMDINTFVIKQLMKLVTKICNDVLVLGLVTMPRKAFV